MLGGNRSLLLHPRPLRRKTSYLDGYYKNGIPVTTAQIGDTVSYDVPGHSPGQVFLVQTINGNPSYSGPFTVPMPARLLGPGDKTGLYANTVYDRQGGSVIETDSLQVNPSPFTQGSGGGPSPIINCGAGMVPYAGYTDTNGNWNAPGCMYPPATSPGTTTAPGGTSSTSTTTTTTSSTAGSSGGGGPVQGGGFPSSGSSSGAPAPGPAPSNTLLIAAVAALALVMLS